MNRKTLSLLLIVLSIVGIIGIILCDSNIENNSMSFSELCISKKEFEELKDKRKEVNNLYETIYFDGNELFYDNKNNRYFYSLVENSKTAYNPTVYINDDNYKIAISDCKINNEIIENNIGINIIVYNNNNYFESEIVCTKLPLLNIYADKKAIDFSVNLDLDREVVESDMKLELFDNSMNSRSSYNGLLRIRGNATSRYDKKGYKITIKNKGVEDNKQKSVSLLSLPKGDEFVLYAGYNDQERVRNVFCSQLWYDGCARDNMFDIDNGFYYKYVELFFNNEYWGLYAIGYQIDEELIQIDSTNINENIYKKINFGENEYVMNSNKDFSTGYELKINTSSKNAWNPLINYYDILLNENSVKEIYDIADIDNSIDLFLFYYVIQGTDNVMRDGMENALLYNTNLISKEKDNRVVILYSPWDFDRTFGKGFGEDQSKYDYEYNRNFIMTINPVYLLLQRGDKQIEELIIEKYSKLRIEEWSDENIKRLLNSYESIIFDSGAYARDIERWPNSSIENTNLKLSVFKEYVINRLHYCDENIYDVLTIN